MLRRAFKSTIRTKVLLVLLVPIIFFCVMFALIFQSLKEADRLVKQERNHSMIIEAANRLILSFANAIGDSLTFQFSGIEDYNDSAKENIKEATGIFDWMGSQELIRNDPKVRVELPEVRNLAMEEFNAMQAMAPPAHGPIVSGIVKRFASAREFLRRVGEVNKRIKVLLAEQTDRVNETRKRQQAEHDRMLAFILCGVVGGLLWAAVGAFALVKGITSRLNILVDNAYRVPRGLPLEKKVSGSDEFEYLDTVLHDAEEYMRDAAEHRRMIMEMVSHDMRSPLMAAQIALEIMTTKADATPEMVQRQTDSLKRNIGLVTNLVNDLLTIDRIEAGNLELDLKIVNVHELVEQGMETLNTLAMVKKIEVKNECGPDMFARVDSDRIVQVIVNLVSNAVKFSPPGSEIVIASTVNGAKVEMSVRDAGPGLPPGDDKRIFNKFYQSKREDAKRGYGLGLAICKMLVELHDGRIGVESKQGEGSRFWFTLPSAVQSVAPPVVQDEPDSNSAV